ncbi:HIT family protein [Enterococcus sp. HY326]|uniref:HIT family protein n=1 Tax=Enterococcus sp. HY326 TaxID=2971265 RepID=UPI0022404159|nr:HIT family protein [Enterococcus sp. HY326]
MQHCIFCHGINGKQILKETAFFFVVLDMDPIQEGHLLLIAKKHYHSLVEIPEEELMDLFRLEKEMLLLFEEHFSMLRVSFIQNNGNVMDAGTHFHLHLIPRYPKDNFWENQEVVWQSLDLTLLKEAMLNS